MTTLKGGRQEACEGQGGEVLRGCRGRGMKNSGSQ